MDTRVCFAILLSAVFTRAPICPFLQPHPKSFRLPWSPGRPELFELEGEIDL